MSSISMIERGCQEAGPKILHDGGGDEPGRYEQAINDPDLSGLIEQGPTIGRGDIGNLIPPPRKDDWSDAQNTFNTTCWALANGLWPIAITAHDSDKTPNPGKAPLGRDWGVKRRSKGYFRAIYRHNPTAGIGLKLGAEGGIIDIDVDDPEAAQETLARLFPDGLPPTLGWLASKGPHLLFRYDARLAAYDSIIKGVMKDGKVQGNPHYLGIEIRIGAHLGGDQQIQTVIPPSRFTDGTRRVWNENGLILPLPESVFEDLGRFGRIKAQSRPIRSISVPRSIRSDAERTYALSALEKECALVASAIKGYRNDQLNRSSFAIGQLVQPGALAYHEAETELKRAASVAEARYGDTIGADETIRSGLEDGMADPRDLSHVGNGKGGAGGKPKGDDASPGEAGEEGCLFHDYTPQSIARRLCVAKYEDQGEKTLRRWNGNFYIYADGVYQECSKDEMNGEIHNHAESEFNEEHEQRMTIWAAKKKGEKPQLRSVTTSLVNNVSLSLAARTLIKTTDHPALPFFIGDELGWAPDECVPMGNGIFHLPSYFDGKPCHHKPTPRFFCTHVLPYDFDPHAPQPKQWLKFLSQLWPKDPQSILALQEWMGLQLVPETKHQKIMALIGPKRCGKGTISWVIQSLVGHENHASIRMSLLDEKFMLESAIGKLSLIIPDGRLSSKSDQAAIAENLLSISGEDSLTIRRMHRPTWTGKLGCRITLVSNLLPRLTDSSGALAGRFIVLKFTESFYGREDLELKDKLNAELPGIFLWAVEGWKRLRERGRLIQPETGQEACNTLADMSSPIGAFIRQCCVVGQDEECLIDDIYRAWVEYCKENNRREPGDKPTFGRDLASVVSGIKTRQRGTGPNRVRVYTGIGLIPPSDFGPAPESSSGPILDDDGNPIPF